jgi:hypothetical protein
MSIPVTLSGVTYAIPETGEIGWGDELTNYLIALSNSLLKNDVKFRTRVVTTTPAAVTATDVVIVCNVPSASVVNLPAGVLDRVYMVVDGSGAANTNNITINSTGPTIAGLTSYVIKENYGFVSLVFDGTRWNILAEGKSPIRSSLYRLNDATNASFVEQSVVPLSAGVSVNDLQSCSANFVGSEVIKFTVEVAGLGTFEAITDYYSDRVTALSDMSNLLLIQDAGTGVFVSKSASSATVTFKKRNAGAQAVIIKTLTNRIENATIWS